MEERVKIIKGTFCLNKNKNYCHLNFQASPLRSGTAFSALLQKKNVLLVPEVLVAWFLFC